MRYMTHLFSLIFCLNTFNSITSYSVLAHTAHHHPVLELADLTKGNDDPAYRLKKLREKYTIKGISFKHSFHNMENLLAQISALPQLERFDSGDNFMGYEHLMRFLHALKHHKHLKHISLHDMGIIDEDTSGLSIALKELVSCPHIKSLNLSKNNLTGVGIQKLLPTLKEMPLEQLNLRDNPLDSNALIALSELLKNKKKLKELQVSFFAVTEDSVKRFAETLASLPALQKIILTGKITKEEFDILLAAIPKSVKLIKLSHMLTQDMVPDLPKALARFIDLEHLDLSSNDLDDESMKKFVEGFEKEIAHHFPHLKALSFYDNLINNKGLSIFCDLLKHLSHLKSLDLGKNTFQKAIDSLAAKFSLLPNLERLDLSDNYYTAAQAQPLWNALPNLKKLKALNLSNSQLGDAEIKKLGESLLKMPHILSLDVRGNSITDEGVAFLKTFSHDFHQENKKTPEWRELNLSNNNIRNKGMIMILEALPEFHALTHIHMGSNLFDEQIIDTLEKSISQKPRLKEIALNGTRIIGPKFQILRQKFPDLQIIG